MARARRSRLSGIAKDPFSRLPRFSLARASFVVSLSLSLSLSLACARARESVEREKETARRGEGGGRRMGRNDCTAQKFAINFWRARWWCRVGVIGFAENFYVFSRHLHNVRGEHGPIDRLI